MDIKEVLKETEQTTNKAMAAIKRKALKIAPVFALAIPGGGALVAAFQTYNASRHVWAGQALAGGAMERIKEIEEAENWIFEFAKATAAGDEAKREELNNLYIANVESGKWAEGTELFNHIENIGLTIDAEAMEDTAQMLGYSSKEELVVAMQDPVVADAVKDFYADNLYEITSEQSAETLAGGQFADYDAPMWNTYEGAVEYANSALDVTQFGIGLTAALSAATMAVSMYLLHRGKKKLQKMEAEIENAEQKHKNHWLISAYDECIKKSQQAAKAKEQEHQARARAALQAKKELDPQLEEATKMIERLKEAEAKAQAMQQKNNDGMKL